MEFAQVHPKGMHEVKYAVKPNGILRREKIGHPGMGNLAHGARQGISQGRDGGQTYGVPKI